MALMARPMAFSSQAQTLRPSAPTSLLRPCRAHGAFQPSLSTSASARTCSVAHSRRSLIVRATASSIPSGPPAGPPGQAPRKPKISSKVGSVPIQGQITQNLSNGKFRVKLINGVTVIAHLSGKIRKNKIKIAVGDDVTVELSAYDLTRGRISFRH